MHIESSVTEAVTATTRLPVDMGVAHYDPPPPDRLDDLDALRQADRVLEVDVDGVKLGERAVLEGGRRTAALRAVTPAKAARAAADQLDAAALAEVSRGHRREEG